MTGTQSWDEAWLDVAKVLETKLGQNAARISRLAGIRDDLRRMAAAGIVTAPDFTLHNERHSDNIVLLLGRLLDLQDEQGSVAEITADEGFVLAASAYLHDVGMFFGEARFREEIQPRLSECLRFCPDDKCDAVDTYLSQIQDKSIPHQIRILHHLLGAYLLDVEGTSLFRLQRGSEKSHIIAVCRGHRRADLCKQECACYQSIPEKTGPVRRDLLAGLLRLADALDFYSDRAPVEILTIRAHAFLHSPIALRHWLNHFFAQSVHTCRADETSNPYLDCTITYQVPNHNLLDGRSYKDFLVPLFRGFKEHAERSDFSSDTYPNELRGFLRIKKIKLRYKVVEEAGAVELPGVIAAEVKASGVEDATEFIDYLEQRGVPSVAPRHVMDRKAEIQVFEGMLNGDDLQHRLMVLVGGHGQGKSLLINQFEGMASQAQVPSVKFDLSSAIDVVTLLDGIWHKLGAGRFPTYAARRKLPTEAGLQRAREHEAELTWAFFSDLAVFEDEYQLVLLLDTFERADPVLRSWIEDTLLEYLSGAEGLLTVIAGRESPKISDYWIFHGHFFPLEGVRIRDYQEYAAERKVTLSKEEVETFHQKTGGLPKLFAEYVEALTRETA